LTFRFFRNKNKSFFVRRSKNAEQTRDLLLSSISIPPVQMGEKPVNQRDQFFWKGQGMQHRILVCGAREHNLKNITVELPRDQLIVITGLSGSGKSSLAFDTIYAEGQRRYVESLSAYARQFLEMVHKPDVDSIEGLSPAIAIQQKTTSNNPRSTVGTVTEIYDYLRLLFARAGVPHSPTTGLPIESQTVSQMVDGIMQLPEGSKLLLIAPVISGRKGEYKKELQELRRKGYQRLRIDGTIYNDDDPLPTLAKTKAHSIEVVVDRVVVAPELGNRLADSVEAALKLSSGLLLVESVDGKIKQRYSSLHACPESGFTMPEIEPRLFSFNSPYGACPTCTGLGSMLGFGVDLVVPDKRLSLRDGAIAPWPHEGRQPAASLYLQILQSLCTYAQQSMLTPWRDLPASFQQLVLYGSGTVGIPMQIDGVRLDSKRGKLASHAPFVGVIPGLQRTWEDANGWQRSVLEQFMEPAPCSDCNGYRLKPEALCVKLADHHIGQISAMSVADALPWIQALPAKLSQKQQAIAERVLKEIGERLSFLHDVGLSYLTLSRPAGTLSGGESQRIQLASQIGAGLTGVLYVLDEPSIGLHQHDNQKLLNTLQRLKDLGNTVIVVEHDEDAMRQADYLLDMGPGAGVHGGQVVAIGTPQQVMANPDSLTAAYLTGTKRIERLQPIRTPNPKRVLTIKNARGNNLKGVDATIPLSCFVCVTGLSGSGKSTLILDTLYQGVARRFNSSHDPAAPHDAITGMEYIDKVIDMDQSPIGRTPRSNPATYIGAFTPIRDWFAGLPESKARGYLPGRFSFNVKGGRCEACQGDGLIKIEMHFLPDVYVDCDQCHGQRYNRETLEVTYREQSIAQVLAMTIEEGAAFFSAVPSIREKLQVLVDVGLGYVKLGQSATTLSGGEAQRVKLAKELTRRATGRTLYILDEPTTGLHFEDIRRLLIVLQRLVDQGNTVVVIEHNLDVIKTADWLIDLGPEGGDGGGQIIATGTPEQVAKVKGSYTGQYLQRLLAPKLGTAANGPGAVAA
jgi:excinuclease ABC subunit A